MQEGRIADTPQKKASKKKPVDKGRAAKAVHVSQEMASHLGLTVGAKGLRFGDLMKAMLRLLGVSRNDFIKETRLPPNTFESYRRNRRNPSDESYKKIDNFMNAHADVSQYLIWERLAQLFRSRLEPASIGFEWERTFDMIDARRSQQAPSLVIVAPISLGRPRVRKVEPYAIYRFVRAKGLFNAASAIVRYPRGDGHLRWASQCFELGVKNDHRVISLEPSGPKCNLLRSRRRVHRAETVPLNAVEVLYRTVEEP